MGHYVLWDVEACKRVRVRLSYALATRLCDKAEAILHRPFIVMEA